MIVIEVIEVSKKLTKCIVVLAFVLFALALILFNDMSFTLLGIGVIALSVAAIIRINDKN